MREKFIELIPEFTMIRDNELLERTLRVWEDAIDTGGWSLKDLKKLPFTRLIKKCPIKFIEHVRVVTEVAHQIAVEMRKVYGDKIEINMDYLICGALLHDIGKLLEYRKGRGRAVHSKSRKFLRHSFSGAAIAYKHGIPEEILHIISMQANEGEADECTPEAIIISKADSMDLEVLKCFYD